MFLLFYNIKTKQNNNRPTCVKMKIATVCYSDQEVDNQTLLLQFLALTEDHIVGVCLKKCRHFKWTKFSCCILSVLQQGAAIFAVRIPEM